MEKQNVFAHVTTCICRNTTQSNGWSNQDKSLHDKYGNRSNLRHTIFTRDQYQCNSDLNYHTTNNQHKQASGDHRIRITVNCVPEYNTFSDYQNSNNIDERDSAASVTIVEIDDTNQSDDDIKTPNIIKNSLNDNRSQFSNHSRKPYNEKPIDVPEDFERRAYELQRNELSPFVRVLEPTSQVRFCLFVFFWIQYRIFSSPNDCHCIYTTKVLTKSYSIHSERENDIRHESPQIHQLNK